MNYPWRPAAALNPHADSAASKSAIPRDQPPSRHLPITAGTVASRILSLQKLAGPPKNKSSPKPPSRFPPTRAASNSRRERSTTSPRRSRSPLRIRPTWESRRENSRSSFGRRATNLFGNPASRNSQPSEQLQAGTSHSFLGLRVPRGNGEVGFAREGKGGGDGGSSLRGLLREDVMGGGWGPVVDTLKMSRMDLGKRIDGREVDLDRGAKNLGGDHGSTQAPSTAQLSYGQNRTLNPRRQKEKMRQDEMSNSEVSMRTTSTLRRQSVRNLFDKHGIERPPGLASSEVGREETNEPQRHRVCHLCMWIHDKNENTCWKCGHRLCKACDRLLTFSNGGKDASFDYKRVVPVDRKEASKPVHYVTTPRPSKGQILKQSLSRPLPIPIQMSKKEVAPTEPFPPFYSEKAPPESLKPGPGLDSTNYGPSQSCPGIYKSERSQNLSAQSEEASQESSILSTPNSSCQYVTNKHRSESGSLETHDCRCESCQQANHRSFVCQHSTSQSLARSEDIIAMDGRYAADSINDENIYRSHSYPDSSKTSQPSMRLYRLLNGQVHRAIQLSHESDHVEIPRTSMRPDPFLNNTMPRTTQSIHRVNRRNRTENTQGSESACRMFNGSTYQPVQPSFTMDNMEKSKLLDNYYPFLNDSKHGKRSSRYGSDYVECRGYPRTGHGHCDRSPVSSGILGDCQHCLDDCECSACQSTIHSVRCCTNGVHKPMIHLHRSPAKVSLNDAFNSNHGHPGSTQERKPYILSRSQTYDRSTVHKYDSVSEWLGSPDEPSPPRRFDTPTNTPSKTLHLPKNSSSFAVKQARDSLLMARTPSPWTSSSIILKDIAPLMKETFKKASENACSKTIVNSNRPSSSDGTRDKSAAPARSNPRFPTNSSPGYFSSNPWREREEVNFPTKHLDWKHVLKSPLQKVARRSSDCETSDICGQADWADRRRESEESISRRVRKERFERQEVRSKVRRWEDRRSESRRGVVRRVRDSGGGGGGGSAGASDMVTPVSAGGYFDAQMRWLSSGSERGRGNGLKGVMGSIVEEEGEGEFEGERGGRDDDDDDGEKHDCVWKRRVLRFGSKSIDCGLRNRNTDEALGEERVEGVSGVKGVAIVIHMENGKDLVLRTNCHGGLSWEGLERLLGGERGVERGVEG
ncbi:uncharacterized protein EAE98_001789 [Botrytis deweyae]|uniref:B box-type domain-containing protein n=1 Tax=Botrytis deweyae TaxID=2478750 RepID=A0ABQ7IYT8_9HELO|nr:uncharacterized protein EAE98_001789 [Botrytis deweyae]KAF7937475.1 hypothetical protein EAE98_001789 [Botrytis deweyae]